MRLRLALFCLFAAHAAAAAELPVLAAPWPPFSYDDRQGAAGLGVERIIEAAGVAGIAIRTEIVSRTELLQRAKSQALLLPALGRSAEREKEFQWLAPLYKDQTCFVVRADAATIPDFNAARPLLIGVSGNGATEAMLRRAGLTNLDASPPNTALPRKLRSGRIQGWYATEMTYPYLSIIGGENPGEFKCGPPVETFSLWQAASLAVDAATVAKLRGALAKVTPLSAAQIHAIYLARPIFATRTSSNSD